MNFQFPAVTPTPTSNITRIERIEAKLDAAIGAIERMAEQIHELARLQADLDRQVMMLNSFVRKDPGVPIG